MAATQPYLYYDFTVSVCATCLRRIEAKVVIEDDRVYLDKWCPAHGRERVLIADDADYYTTARERFLKKPERSQRAATPMRWGCPYDCGVCPDHMQHACLTVVEITDHCNLRCPVCYAESGPHRQQHRSLDEVEAMLDAAVAMEGTPDVVQISGGEPTIHPDFFAILDRAKARPIRHLMVNTNGLRIAREPDFAARLAAYQPGFEVYLQLDSLRAADLRRLRGKDLSTTRLEALDRLEAADVSTTLVATLVRGVNDDQVGALIELALRYRCVRGITFQPVQLAGRHDAIGAADRLTLSEVRRAVATQSEVFSLDDVVPVPCNPDALAMAYALKLGDQVVPLTGLLDRETLLAGERNTIVFERDPALRERIFELFSTAHGPEAQANSLHELLCCLPKVDAPSLQYENVFRVLILQFLDAHSFDVRAVKRSCVFFARPDGRMIPFDTYNLFYRDDRAEHLEALRSEIEQSFGRDVAEETEP